MLTSTKCEPLGKGEIRAMPHGFKGPGSIPIDRRAKNFHRLRPAPFGNIKASSAATAVIVARASRAPLCSKTSLLFPVLLPTPLALTPTPILFYTPSDESSSHLCCVEWTFLPRTDPFFAVLYSIVLNTG